MTKRIVSRVNTTTRCIQGSSYKVKCRIEIKKNDKSRRTPGWDGETPVLKWAWRVTNMGKVIYKGSARTKRKAIKEAKHGSKIRKVPNEEWIEVEGKWNI